MDLVNVAEGKYEHHRNRQFLDSDDSSDSDNDASNSDDVKEDLQKNIPECYRSDNNIASSTSDGEDDDFQATALCQFMDILNDLDEVLDKSLLACLDNSTKSLDNSQVFHDEPQKQHQDPCSSADYSDVITACKLPVPDRPNISKIGRSKSFSDLTRSITPVSIERTEDSVRGSMRRLDPIVLPALTAEQSNCEPLTLPVILFLEHNVHMRPTSAPIQLQVTAANVSGDVNSGPLIVGRRRLLMNRALSLPSTEESDIGNDWTGRRSTARSVTRSASSSSSSSDSLNGVLPSMNPLPSATEERNNETEDPPFGVWPHGLSSMLACLSCTVGIFNISRFAVFSVHFGASFIVQFFILSFLIGIPLFTLHLCLGHVLESGPVDMWRISPICKGVGIALLLSQAIMGVYSIIGLSWIFVFFRDSFINAGDKYRWALPHSFGYDDNPVNMTFRIQETLPDYFHGEVLQRNLSSINSHFGTIKFQVAFNLAVVWMIVFVCLSKGLRSYGKAIYALIFLPICGTIVLCAKLLTLIPYDSVTNIFYDTQWSEFFTNTNSWVAASQETFLTWGLLGVSVMQLSSHKNNERKSSKTLQRECKCIVGFTFAVLLLAAFLANACVLMLKNSGLVYATSSFETVKSSQFLWSQSDNLHPTVTSTPIRLMSHYASLVGLTVWKVGPLAQQISGWQPLQLATQIVPSTLAVISTDLLSPVWAIIFYFILITFGIAQQLAIWHCVITGMIAINTEALKIWETTITFLSCLAGLLFGLMLSTDAGIRIIHYIDYIMLGGWWHCLIQVALICAVFIIRGRPYSGEVVAEALYQCSSKISAAIAVLLTLTWNVVLPIALCAISIIDFRAGQQRVLYNWRKQSGYWPIWTREIAVAVQQSLLLVIPLTAFIQTWRYISKGPPDILDRIQNLYRPRMGSSPPPPVVIPSPIVPPPPSPPPKYTPPPSYSTATGGRLIHSLRRSYRTLRRMTLRPESTPDTTQIPITLSETIERDPAVSIESQPPEYNSGLFTAPSLTITDEIDSSRPTTSRNSLNLTREFLRRSFIKSDSVKNIRSSLRRSFKYGANLNTSNEYLVRGAEPMSNTVAMSAMLEGDRSPQRSRASVI